MGDHFSGSMCSGIVFQFYMGDRQIAHAGKMFGQYEWLKDRGAPMAGSIHIIRNYIFRFFQ